jgi:hypothetical protein
MKNNVPPLKNTFFYLLGFPGTGKLTIAKEILKQEQQAAIAQGEEPVIRLVDNHLINNPIFNIVKLDGSKLPEKVWENTGKIWDVVFETMTELSPADMSFIQTNALANEDPTDVRLFNKVAKVAAARKAHFVPVRLLCAQDELEKRITSPERKAKLKDTNPNTIKEQYNSFSVITPQGMDYLDLDVTSLSPQDSAQKIRAYAAQSIS